MAEKIECVIAGDCVGDGEAFLRGETRIVSKDIHRALVAAGRVCRTDEEIDAAKAELEARKPAPKAKKTEEKPPGETKPPGNPTA